MQRQTDIWQGDLRGAADRGRDVYGAKLAVFLGGRMPVILRDDIPTIPDPGRYDLPGGGCEPGESALDCVLRETFEELSLRVRPTDIHYADVSWTTQGREVWFFAARLDPGCAAGIRLGDEGQSWRFMTVEEYLCHPRAIAAFQTRLADYLAS
ncbi:NUDIX domain-containing protein [Pseudooceanicola algae]|uniref:Uncharacterized protein n=1 Tax=Pseudooceanicola algae TaxID=1537215 RepID=A0A418SIH1_9RHOB|nr:NUDIX hydrolase [Pseudooceanicola algae]QPM91825.1 hypothetical protein PSAL_030810 [Pseudooceanicola algae]